MKYLLWIPALCLNGFLAAQTVPKIYTQTEEIRKHIEFLASDSLQGREVGTYGEKLAAKYIAQQMRWQGLEPKGSTVDNYYQEFSFVAGRTFNKQLSSLSIKKEHFIPQTDFFPLEFSGSSPNAIRGELVYIASGVDATADLLKNKVAVIEIAPPIGSDDPHHKNAAYASLNSRAELAKQLGAVGVIFINTADTGTPPTPNYERTHTLAIPVVYVPDATRIHPYCHKKTKVTIQIVLDEDKRIGSNVVGFLDNKAPNTIILGAHFDHLGLGHFGSRSADHTPAIHNGADDNASGVALMLSAIPLLKEPAYRHYNYLFIGFSAEEAGLVGSNAFVKKPTYPLDKVTGMFNFDMVGRLKDRKLIINGAGTSPVWHPVIRYADSLSTETTITTTESGIGPSDHTSFYLQNIPVLAFFTGIHDDYHKPSDDAELINYVGIARIQQVVLEVLKQLDGSKLSFTKTKDNENRQAAAFKVTLGIMPGYAYEGEGVLADGVLEGKPAAQAGILAGDIITAINDVKLHDIYDYMEQLAKYKKGDKVSVTLVRKEETMVLDVQF
jgi:aminopeptidase YwaD